MDGHVRLYDASKGALSREGLPLKIMAASIAATIGSALANPADLVKGTFTLALCIFRVEAFQ